VRLTSAIIIRPHRQHCTHAVLDAGCFYTLPLHIAWTLCVCMLSTLVSPAVIRLNRSRCIATEHGSLIVFARWRPCTPRFVGPTRHTRVCPPPCRQHNDRFSRFCMVRWCDEHAGGATCNICSNSPHLCTRCVRCGLRITKYCAAKRCPTPMSVERGLTVQQPSERDGQTSRRTDPRQGRF